MTANLFADMRAQVLDALRAVLPDVPPDVAARVEVTPTREVAHGDMATNAAMVAAKVAGRKPAELAAAIAAGLRGMAGIEAADVAGPGFVNMRLAPSLLREQIPVILRAGESYGDCSAGRDVAVNVEYVSANPTGPMHIGHCRGAVVGDALSNLLRKAGYAVTKEYYINDAGAQVVALAWAAYWRYLQAIGTTLTEDDFAAIVPGGLQYKGDYLVPVGNELAMLHGTALAAEDATPAAPALWLDVVRDTTIAKMLECIREDLAALGVVQDVFTSERALLEGGAVDHAIAILRAKNLVYEGVLEPPKGKAPEDWEPRPQTLFQATRFGDDVDRPLKKSDGSNTYFANDIAYHADKVARGAQVMIDVWGADHGGYVQRMKAAVRAVAGDAVEGGGETLDIVLCQIVHVLRQGVPVRMSKRAGSFVTLRDLIDEVGRDVVRFTMLFRKPDAQMEFDLDLAVAQTRENPVYYVQYVHARCRSVLRRAAEMFGDAAVEPEALAGVDLACLGEPAELAVLRRLIAWPRVVEGAAQAHEPHRIAFFLYDLASDFNFMWQSVRTDATLRFIREEHPVETRARLALVSATATVIRSGLAVAGVVPAEELRDD